MPELESPIDLAIGDLEERLAEAMVRAGRAERERVQARAEADAQTAQCAKTVRERDELVQLNRQLAAAIVERDGYVDRLARALERVRRGEMATAEEWARVDRLYPGEYGGDAEVIAVLAVTVEPIPTTPGGDIHA